jgi:hypothetical protein
MICSAAAQKLPRYCAIGICHRSTQQDAQMAVIPSSIIGGSTRDVLARYVSRLLHAGHTHDETTASRMPCVPPTHAHLQAGPSPHAGGCCRRWWWRLM